MKTRKGLKRNTTTKKLLTENFFNVISRSNTFLFETSRDKFLSVPPSERTQALARWSDSRELFDINERKEAEAALQRYKRAVNARISKKHKQKLMRLTKIPQWITDLPNKEYDEFQAVCLKYHNACNRQYITRKWLLCSYFAKICYHNLPLRLEKPSQRTQKLANLTEDLLYKHRMWYCNWLNADHEKFYVPKRRALTFKSKNGANIEFLY